MKKGLILLISLALVLLALPVFADGPSTKIQGNFIWSGNWDLANSAQAASAAQSRLAFDTQIDKYNELYIQLREEGNFTKNQINVAEFYLNTDLGAALGGNLPVTLKLQTGYFDTYFTNWWYADSNGWDFYYAGPKGANWSNGLNNSGQVAQGAYQLNVGAGPVTFHLYNDLLFNNLLVGAEGAFGGLGFYASYGAYGMNTDKANLSKGTISIELKYDLPAMGDLKASVYPFFRYGLDSAGTLAGAATGNTSSAMVAGLSAAVDYTMFHVGLGATLNNFSKANTFGLDHAFVEASVAATKEASVGAGAYLDGQASSMLSGIDLHASYMFGAAKLLLGYVVGGSDKIPVHLDGDNYSYANGLYGSVDISF